MHCAHVSPRALTATRFIFLSSIQELLIILSPIIISFPPELFLHNRYERAQHRIEACSINTM
jgi:hypothetical protein